MSDLILSFVQKLGNLALTSLEVAKNITNEMAFL